MFKFYILLLILLFQLACQSMQQKHLKTNSYVIFIPGYYGSQLNLKDSGERVWINLSQALWGDQTLALANEDIDVPDAKPLQVDGVLDEVRVIPGLYSMNIYGDAFEGLQTRLKGHSKIIPFAYDWRKDLVHASQKLNALVNKLKSKGAKSISIVAHSMGGMLASYYLIYGDQDYDGAVATFSGARKIDHLITLGAPFKGTMHVFRNMQLGVKAGLNDKALEAHAVASFPSSYTLIPMHNYALIDLKNKDLSDQLFDLKSWKSMNWGLLSNKHEIDQKTYDNRVEFTSLMLKRARHFYRLLHNFQSDKKLETQILFYIGNSEKMIHKALVSKDLKLLFPNTNSENELEGYNKSKLLSPGDGSVTVYSAQPPRSFYDSFDSVNIVETTDSHLELINSEKNLNEISRILMTSAKSKK